MLHSIEMMLGSIHVADCPKYRVYLVYAMSCCGECLCSVDPVLELSRGSWCGLWLKKEVCDVSSEGVSELSWKIRMAWLRLL